MKALLLIAAAWLCGIAAVHAQERSEVPITERILSDGTRRYTIPITVGSTVIEAGLDSGSTGLRVLPNVLAAGDAKASDDGDQYAYQSGTQLSGSIATASVTIGMDSGTSGLELVQRISCVSQIPNCPASQIPQSQFGVQGNGLPGEGFKAIIGINTAEADANNPLMSIGVKRWIIELPRPGISTPGKLILNPSDAEVLEFRTLPTMPEYRTRKSGLHDSVRGCLIKDDTKSKICGVLTMDTGAPGIIVENPVLNPIINGRFGRAETSPDRLFARYEGPLNA